MVNSVQNNFSGGELSPRLFSRNTLDVYKNSTALCSNFLIYYTGGLETRPGTRYIDETKSGKVRLISFEFKKEQAYILEFGHNYIRFFKDKGQIVNGSNIPVEITSPYTVDDLPLIKTHQNADSLYIVTGKHPVYKLTRTSHYNWSLTEYKMLGPFIDQNITDTTISASSALGTTTLTASAALFTSADVGRCVAMKGTFNAWAASTAYSLGAVIYNTVDTKTRTYKCLSAGTSSTGGPSGVGDRIADGSCLWDYLDDGKSSFGFATITAYSSPTSVTASVDTQIPTTATKAWKLGAFYGANQPAAVTIFGSRLWFGGTPAAPDTVWASKTNEFNKFITTEPALDTDSITGNMNSGSAAYIRWFKESNDNIIVGTSDGIMRLYSGDNSKAITSGTLRQVNINAESSANIQGIRVGNSTLFVGGSRQKLMELSFDFGSDSYVANSQTLLAEHMAGETKINHIVYQADPWSTIWGLRDDGSLVSYVYLREQKLSGWARHDVGGFVESIAVIPSPDYEESQLWLSVRRTINGVEKRYVEVIESMNTHKQYEKDWWCVDCGSVYEGVSVSTISGLDYLEGHTVVYLADGAIGKETVVTNGKITLQTPASKVVVGLPIMAVVKTLPLDLNQGTIQGKQKVIHKVRIDKYMSYGGKIGSGLDKLDILFDTPNYSLAKMSSDSKTINYNGGWNREGQIYIVQDKPVPLFIKGIEYTFTLGS